jgi:hypothetical protein
MKLRFLTFLLIACSFSFTSSVYAQHDGNGGGPGQGSGNVPTPADRNNEHGSVNNGGNYNNGVNKDKNAQAPFDGGLSVLAGAGVLYGLKKARDKRKKAKAEAI